MANFPSVRSLSLGFLPFALLGALRLSVSLSPASFGPFAGVAARAMANARAQTRVRTRDWGTARAKGRVRGRARAGVPTYGNYDTAGKMLVEIKELGPGIGRGIFLLSSLFSSFLSLSSAFFRFPSTFPGFHWLSSEYL